MPAIKVKDFLVKTITTGFGVGYLPLMPGTYGSLVGLGIFWLVRDNLIAQATAILILLSLGFWLSGPAEKLFKQKDPPRIIIDEISGMLLSLLFIPYDLTLALIAFLLFRILDTLKAYPSGKIQHIRGSIGVMGDDIIAAVYTNLILQIVTRVMFGW
jgi:phosphatidylglycerophosphatase A